MSRQPYRVLLVDDSPEDREFYQRCLLRDREQSCTVLEASMGQQGLELWQQQQPDIVLLDYRLPDLDGLEFLKQLQSLTQQPYLPVVVVTGQGNEAIAVQAMKAGAQDYLVKEQITPERLQLAIKGAIKTVQLRTQLQQRVERERLIAHITQQIHQSLDLDYILQTVVTEVRQFLRTDRVLVFQLNANDNGNVIAESVGAKWRSLLSATICDPCLTELYQTITRSNEWDANSGLGEDDVIAIADVDASDINPYYVELLTQFQVKANLVVPIVQDSQLWGLLIAHHCVAPRTWQTLEIEMLKELATQVSIALRQAELYQQSQRELAERKRVEAELRDSEERLRSALIASRMGTWDWNIQTGSIQWSDNLEGMFGLESGTFDGSFEMFSERLHPDDRDRVLATIDHAIATGEDYNIEFRIVYPSGRVRWALSQGKVFYDPNGQPIRMAGNDIDITERKQADVALQESEERFRQLAENIDVVFWMKEVAADRVIYVSPAYERLWNLNPQQLYDHQQSWIDYIHPDDRESVDRAFQTKAADGLFDEEYRIVLPNGNVRWVRDRCFPLHDITGKICRFTGIAEDITNRRQIEDMLRLQAQVLDQTHDSVVTTDLHGTITSWNHGAERLFGYTDNEMLGQPVSQLYPKENHEFLHREVIAPLKAKGVHEVEVVAQCKSGDRIDLLLSLSLLRDEYQNAIGMIGFSMDISDRKRAEQALRESEERFRTSIENMLDCFAIYRAVRNSQGDIVDFQAEYINDAACLSSQIPRDQHLSRGLCELVPDYDSGLFEEYCQVVETGLPLVKDSLIYEDEFGKQHLIKAFDIRVAKFGDGYIATWRDITARKRAEHDLRENEQLLRLALTGAQAGSWNWELLTNTIVWSPENYDLYGLDPALISPQYSDWYNTLHPDDREQANAEVSRVVTEKLPELRAEFRIIHPQRGIRWLLALGRLSLNEQGEPIRLSGINLDITDRRQAEEALRQSEEFKRRMLDSSSDCIKLLDLHGRLLYMNTGGLCLLEIDDIKPYLNGEWINFWQGHDRDEAEVAIATAKAGNVGRFQGFCETAKGTPKWWDIVVSPILSTTGQVVQLLAVSRDITERKQAEEALRDSEERFRTLADNMSQFAWMADASGWIFWYNQRWFDYTGTTLEEMQGWGWRNVHHPDHVERVVQHIRHCFETGELWEDTFPLRGKDGHYRWFLSRAIPIRNEHGNVLRWFGTNTDITARKQAEIERDRLLANEQAARADAERANRIKDEFLAVLSHELRSPLNPILGWTKLMQSRKFDSAKTAEALSTIERNAKLQCQLIDDLLDVAKILRGKLSFDATPIDLAFVIEAAIDTVRAAALSKNILIHPVLRQIGRVSGDAARLQQIVWNLVSNAIKFTPANGRVEIRLERVGDQAQIVVSDTGRGINPDFLPYIFESFRQEDASTTRKYGGLGLGLAIVRHLVEAHGGTIWADSDGEGQGASFTLQLPLLDSAPEQTSLEQVAEQDLDLTGLRVLTVDDDLDTRELLAVLLTQYGAEVLAVSSVAEVLANLESFRPNVLVSDIGMPDVDGYSLIQQIRALPPEQGGQIPAIALTAYAREEDRKRAIACGFQRQVTKPLDPDQLVQVLIALTRPNSES